jgi:hypothetical protein
MSAQPRWEPTTRAVPPAERRLEPAGSGAPEASASVARAVAALAIASLGAAAVHVAAAIADAEEGGLTVAFFVTVAVAQAAWGLVALAGASRAWLALGAIGNLAVLAVWIASRTVGLPIGEASEAALPVAFPDTVASALEAFIAIGAGVLAFRAGRVRRPAAQVPAFTAVAGLVVAAVAVVAVLAQLGVIEGLSAAS